MHTLITLSITTTDSTVVHRLIPLSLVSSYFWRLYSGSDVCFLSPHHDLSTCTGVQTYIGFTAKEVSSQVSIYLNPDSTPEQKLKMIPDKIENIENGLR